MSQARAAAPAAPAFGYPLAAPAAPAFGSPLPSQILALISIYSITDARKDVTIPATDQVNQCNANRCILDTSAGDTCQSASTVKISYLQLPSKFLNFFVLPHAICFKAGNISFSQSKCVGDVTFGLLAAFDGVNILLDICVLLFDLCTCSDPVNAARRALIHMASK